MFFNSNDYSLDKEYRNRQMHTVGRLDQLATLPAPRLSFVNPGYRIILCTIFFVFVATMMFGSNAVGATDDMRRANADPSSSASVQSALILGDFYFDNGQYEKAVAEFSNAIELMPETLFELMPAQAVVFWQLGDAQFMAGYYEEALISYQRFLELTGDNATPLAHTYVKQLTEAIQIGNVSTIGILGG